MSQLAALQVPELDGVGIKFDRPSQLSLSGTITNLNPGTTLGPFLRDVHDAALADGLKQLSVDVTGLTFVNSSAIRLFIDWAIWLKGVPEASRYKLVFETDRTITWQRTSFLALRSLATGVVEIRS